eukprot:738356-Hanusia_phi.AAC.1
MKKGSTATDMNVRNAATKKSIVMRLLMSDGPSCRFQNMKPMIAHSMAYMTRRTRKMPGLRALLKKA